MAIQTAGGSQTELQLESREEQLNRLYTIDCDILELENKRVQYVSEANAIKNNIKAREKDKQELMSKLGRGQMTFNVTAAEVDEDPEAMDGDDYPTEEDLDICDDLAADVEEVED